MKHEKSCGCIIFASSGAPAVLLTKNLRGGHWSFPKGHVEPGETERDTAIREVREETGLNVEPLSDKTIENIYKSSYDTVKTVLYFVAETAPDAKLVPQPEEVSEIKWLPVSDVPAALTYRNDVRVFERALEYYNSRSRQSPTD